jgi:hypothetical protein
MITLFYFEVIMTPEQEKFFSIIDQAVAFNVQNQLANEDSRKYMAQAHWMEEFGTVSLDMGRRAGKSLYIQKRVTKCDLIICINEEAKRHIFKDCPHVTTAEELFDVFRMVRGPSPSFRLPRDMYWNKVFIDDPGLIFKSRYSREDFFNLMANRCNQIIMLGTPVR